MPIPEFWKMLRNMRNDDTCVIMGNGPSLNQVPLDWLNSMDTFSANNIFMLPGFQPKWYVSVNPLVVEQSADQINAMDATKFITESLAHKISGSIPLHIYRVKKFSKKPWEGIFEGYTVTFVSMQLAFALGYKTVLLVGVDHRYQYKGLPNEEQVLEGDDPNHFDPKYFKGQRWNLPDLRRSEQSYIMARFVFENDNRTIINLGPDSALDVFPKSKLEDWL